MTLQVRTQYRIEKPVHVGLSMEKAMVERVDALDAHLGKVGRSEVIRRLVERGLETLDPD